MVVPIEIALLGCGHPHVADVLGVIASEPDLRLAAVWDADRSVVPGPLSSYAVSDADTAIARADSVVICAPTDQRPTMCARAAQAGRPILVETPVARTAGEAWLLAREVARSRTPALPALFLRELPALARLRSAIRAGLLGRLSGVRAGFAHPRALDGTLDGAAGWMQDPRRAGVGGFGDLAIDLVDMLASLGEVPRLDLVSLDRVRGGGDFGGAAVGRWGQVPLTVWTSWATRPGGLELMIEGARASAILRQGSLELGDGSRSAERWVGSPPDAGEALRAFAARLRTRRLPRDGLSNAIRAQEVIERASVAD
jgi:predicted dehydrogenase